MVSLKSNKIATISIVVNLFLIFFFATFVLAIRNSTFGSSPEDNLALDSSQVLTEEAIAEHNSENDCWIIIENKVYNVTSYIGLHPGGKDEIIEVCGTDATNDFDTKGGEGEDHSENAHSLLNAYYLGDLGDTPANSELANNSLLREGRSNELVASNSTTASHNTASDCWIVINGNTYDVTNYIPLHPGGQSLIINACGGDATAIFNNKGGVGSHSTSAWNLLENYRINPDTANDNPAPPPVDIPKPIINPPAPIDNNVQLTMEEVAKHNSASNCWFVVNNNVYNVTNYIPFHPGGQSRIINTCGTDASSAYNSRGGSGKHSTSANNQLAAYLLGPLNSSVPGDNGGGNNGGGGNDGGNTINSPQEAILAAYPGATITEVNSEDDGSSEVKFTHNGTSYEAKLDSAFNILEAKPT